MLILPAGRVTLLQGSEAYRTTGVTRQRNPGHLAPTGMGRVPTNLPAGADWIHLTFIVLLAAAAAFQAGCFVFGVW
ncbi:MAG TPA: hypothetical protein VGD78_11305 [Chthoniobacterales bacterium]